MAEESEDYKRGFEAGREHGFEQGSVRFYRRAREAISLKAEQLRWKKEPAQAAILEKLAEAMEEYLGPTLAPDPDEAEATDEETPDNVVPLFDLDRAEVPRILSRVAARLIGDFNERGFAPGDIIAFGLAVQAFMATLHRQAVEQDGLEEPTWEQVCSAGYHEFGKIMARYKIGYQDEDGKQYLTVTERPEPPHDGEAH